MDWNNEWVFLKWINEILEGIKHKIFMEIINKIHENELGK